MYVCALTVTSSVCTCERESASGGHVRLEEGPPRKFLHSGACLFPILKNTVPFRLTIDRSMPRRRYLFHNVISRTRSLSPSRTVCDYKNANSTLRRRWLGRTEGRKEGRKEASKEARKEGSKEGRNKRKERRSRGETGQRNERQRITEWGPIDRLVD